MEKNQDKQPFALPKNIRQIGNFGETYKIYVEDFVYTYVHQFLHEKKEENMVLTAVLLGEVKKEGDMEYVFISGAQRCEFGTARETKEETDVKQEEEAAQENDRQQEFWNNVYQGIKQYFSDKEILGWYINLDGSNLEIHPWLQQFFEATYGKGSRFLYYEDSLDRADAFFVQEQHSLQRISGYAVYYEKNPQMQEFMISEKQCRDPKPAESAAAGDAPQEDVASNYRALMNKIHEKPKKRRIQPAIYAAGVAVLAIVTATGVAQIGNYQNLRVLENTMQTLSGAVKETPEADKEEKENAENERQDAAAQKEEDIQADSAVLNAASSAKPQEDQMQSGGGGSQQAAPAEAPQNQEAAPSEEGQSQEEQPPAPETGQAQESQAAQTAAEAKPEYYTVKKGDSLVSISRRFYHNIKMVDEICSLNKIENMDVIYEGQKLRLP